MGLTPPHFPTPPRPRHRRCAPDASNPAVPTRRKPKRCQRFCWRCCVLLIVTSLLQLPLQRGVRLAGPESEPVRRERHAVADVSKAVAVRCTELQLILAVLLEREAEV